MNLHQIERKRLRELLGAIREARHVVHAERPAIARALRLAHAAKRKVNAAVTKATRVSETLPSDDITLTLDATPVVEWQGQQAAQLADAERTVLKQLAKLERAKDIAAGTVTNPRVARQRRKAAEAKREARQAAKRAEHEKQLRTTLLHLRQRLHEITDKDVQRIALRAIDCAERSDRFLLGGYTSMPGFPDWLRDGLREAYKLLVAID